MRRWHLLVLLACLWLLAPVALALGIATEAPSFVVMPVVAVVAAFKARDLRDAWLLPGLVMLLPGTYALVTGLASDGVSLALADRVLWIHMIHVIPVVVVAVTLRWVLERWGPGGAAAAG